MKKVLVIEDNEDNQILISMLLENAGYQVITADTGEGGYSMAKQQLPDLILLDIQLPDIMGTEVLRRLRLEETTHAIPVIAATSYAMAGDRERLLGAGCDGYIEKPIDPGQVINQIERIYKDKK